MTINKNRCISLAAGLLVGVLFGIIWSGVLVTEHDYDFSGNHGHREPSIQNGHDVVEGASLFADGISHDQPLSRIDTNGNLITPLTERTAQLLNLRLFDRTGLIDARTCRILGLTDAKVKEVQVTVDKIASQRDRAKINAAVVVVDNDAQVVDIKIPKIELPYDCWDQSIKRELGDIVGPLMAAELLQLDYSSRLFQGGVGSKFEDSKAFILRRDESPHFPVGSDWWILAYATDGATAWRGTADAAPVWLQGVLDLNALGSNWDETLGKKGAD